VHVNGCLEAKRQIPCLMLLINERLAKHHVKLVDARRGKNFTEYGNVYLKQQVE
jgi:hypothetical protein